jgi:ATP-binding cassette subfamily B protein/ATP-binding cassette subfamily C protein
LIQELALYAYLIFLVIQKGLAVGSLTIYLSAVGRLAQSLSQVMQSYLELAKISLDVRDFKKFMEIPLSHQVSGDKIPVFDKNSFIEFKNVSFKYPNSDNYALKNMSIIIRGDEKLCIVGANGSGKSTFIKLLTRFYKPIEGEILLNGINVNEYDFIKYQGMFSPVFQDFSLYYMTLGENIVLDKEYDEERLKRIGARSGLTPLLNKLPSGYNAHLWSMNQWDEENSFAPSGGEGQRIAIARAVYHDSLIYLLDEPTAALDPIAEYEIYTQFNDMITDKSAVLITHRLSAVQLADKVAVFDNGGLIEYGTHKQLYEKNGTYADMFNKQAQFYIDGYQPDEQ